MKNHRHQSVPKDWISTTKFGTPMFIEELPFCILPIKCPIENPLSVKNLEKSGDNFTWPDALSLISKKFKNIENFTEGKTPVVTNVIDLTGTELNDRRYYRGTELHDLYSIKYWKIRTMGGGGRLPHNGIINKFADKLNTVRRMFNGVQVEKVKHFYPDFDLELTLIMLYPRGCKKKQRVRVTIDCQMVKLFTKE